MDGYAIALNGKNDFNVVGEIKAGDDSKIILKESEAARIFTGAAIPAGANTVVMQEVVEVLNGKILVAEEYLKNGTHIRLRSSQTKQGEIAMYAGTKLTAGAIGFLASLGIKEVENITSPSICIVVTGNELVNAGQPLKHGQIYESNSSSLTAALKEINIAPKNIFKVTDDAGEIAKHIAGGIVENDIVIVTGGISVGDYDFVLSAMQSCGVETIFYKVKQKPGKPIFFGRKNKTLLFALPGNPSAVLTCFYEYILPCIKKMTGRISLSQQSIKKILSSDFKKKEGHTFFPKGKTDGDFVLPLDKQESYQMSSFAVADCMIVLKEEKSFYEKGEEVEIHLFNNFIL